ncbi:YaiI/YqxD family protein [Bacteriovoracaceae bacterium]|nr:YaiI/YqxD family protein [Bacteriovoracaceae bacterium]
MALRKIWIDADACPKSVKEVIFQVSGRLKIQVTLVANSYMHIPQSPYIDIIKVDKGADVADFFIVENCDVDDLIITADIPLAKLIVDKGTTAINPRGEVYTEENISERLSMRDFMTELRDSGMVTGGPAPLGQKDKIAFTNSLNKIITQMMKP